ncbi:hypothetical protein N0V88_006780 [Collariella sp. IMI 366227]|nr:hypothetical protein N0V88_006780 [Collariella sp. IMI 366227]
MDSDNEGDAPLMRARWGSEDNLPQPEEVPGLNKIIEQLRQEIGSWCKARPEASTLDLEGLYEELRQLDTKETSLLPKDNKNEYYNKYAPKPAALMLRDAKRDEIVRGFDPRKQLLRSRALDLSRDKLQPRNITDLPVEILNNIFKDLQEDAIPGDHQEVRWSGFTSNTVYSRKLRRAVGRIRLVCRTFCELTSQFMFPLIRLQVNQSSLGLLEKVSRNPRMAEGVKGFQISLGYRPQEYADDIAQFAAPLLVWLEKFTFDADCELDSYTSGVVPEDEIEEAEQTRLAALSDAVTTSRSMLSEWRSYLGAAAPRAAVTKHQKLLQRTHAEYRRLHLEQHQLLRDGTFAVRVAQAAARMSYARSISFVDSWDEGYWDFWKEFLNHKQPSRTMLFPARWTDLEDHARVAPEISTAKLLWQLPIAMRKASAPLREIDINVFPRYSNFSMLRPVNQAGEPVWDELAKACEQLRVLEVSVGNETGIRYFPLAGEDKANIDGFLSSILSRCSQTLRILELDITPLGVNTGTGTDVQESYYHVGAILGVLGGLPKFRRVYLNSVDLDQSDLDALTTKVGPSFEDLDMFRVRLLNGGSWADTIDTWRQRVAEAAKHSLGPKQNSRWRVEVSHLLGGCLDESRPRRWTSWYFGEEGSGETEILGDEIKKYVSGQRETNPLRPFSA